MLSEAKVYEVAKRIRDAKNALMQSNPFFSILLSYMSFGVDENCETAYTDGRKIAFSPDFTDKLDAREMQFVLCHEIMHVAMRHLSRPGAQFKNQYLWNIATDIVVNSNIAAVFGIPFITLRESGESMHLAPDGKEGYNYSAEEVYDMLIREIAVNVKSAIGDKDSSSDIGAPSGGGGNGKGKNPMSGNSFDNHDHWGDHKEDREAEAELWRERVSQTVKIAQSVSRIRDWNVGVSPAFQRLVNRFDNSQTDWRTLLNNFIQEEVNDYSFNPPDRRFSDSFILPDFNDKIDKVKNVLFMVDTSGSISDNMLTQAYSEIKGAIDQFNGNLEGYLGFFDDSVTPAVPFSAVDDLTEIKPVGNGGTSFDIIFKYINEDFIKKYDVPSTIVILTDGYARFPAESVADGIPVLWLICDDTRTPPWGTVARIEEK